MTLSLLDPGLETRLVDFGRTSSRSLGVPIGGAADRAAFTLANALVGNPPETPGFEIAVKGPVLRAETDLACALVGAPFAVERGFEPLAVNASFNVAAGQRLSIAGCPRGMRAYFCVAGGFETKSILGSKSGLAPLKAGDQLTCRPGQTKPLRLPRDVLSFPTEWRLRVTPGPQAHLIADDVFSQPFVVDRASNRMGLRLNGPHLPPAAEMVSEPVCPGCVQITRAGSPIVLGVDCQTIGGYPNVAVVIDADLDLLAQIRPDDRVVFECVDHETARRAWRERSAWLMKWLTRIHVSVDVGVRQSRNRT